jgi:hypothetical protein
MLKERVVKERKQEKQIKEEKQIKQIKQIKEGLIEINFKANILY